MGMRMRIQTTSRWVLDLLSWMCSAVTAAASGRVLLAWSVAPVTMGDEGVNSPSCRGHQDEDSHYVKAGVEKRDVDSIEHMSFGKAHNGVCRFPCCMKLR